MNRLLRVLLLILCCLGWAWADSPLTSTPIWKGYRDLPEVALARDIERLNTRLAYYLLSSASLDKKVAVVNALSWNYEGKQNAMLFREVLAQKYKTEKFDTRLSGEERLCLAYLTSMDDYFHVDKAYELARQAQKQLPHSFTAAMVTALIEAQKDFSQQDRLWAIVQPVFSSKTLKADMRPAARQEIYNYMVLYKNKL